MRILYQPDPAESPAGAQNTDSAAEPQNTGDGQGSRPQSADPSEFVSRGIKIGIERVMKRLGLSEDLDEAAEQIASLRNGPQSAPRGEQNDVQASDISAHPEYQKLAREFGTLQRQKSKYDQEIERLRLQADEARIEKIRSAALAAGVGPGGQLEAFLGMYGNRLVFGEDRSLEVLGKLNDGTMAPMGQSLDEFFRDVLEENEFLRRPRGSGGNGSSMSPIRKAEPIDRTGANYDPKSNYAAFGVKSGSDGGKMDQLLSRRRPRE